MLSIFLFYKGGSPRFAIFSVIRTGRCPLADSFRKKINIFKAKVIFFTMSKSVHSEQKWIFFFK